MESPLFPCILNELDLTHAEREIASNLHAKGYAVLDFPDAELGARIDRIKSSLATRFGVEGTDTSELIEKCGGRVQDAWTFDADVRAIASNQKVLELLSKLYGRQAFPFQTLNFPVGTQQHLHSDSIHFSSVPERFMCGVWLAMEDIHPDAGPLTYLPGSHKWPIVTNTMIGRRGFSSPQGLAQTPFETAWEALVQASGLEQEVFIAKKGQAVIWAANLLHGGSAQKDFRLTRWSQVTHYYFDDCVYYTPAFSDEPLGRLDLRAVVDIRTEQLKPNLYLGEEIGSEAERPSLFSRIKSRIQNGAGIPPDFDPESYYRLNPDVAAAGFDAVSHYRAHGKLEGRRYRHR